MRIWQRERELDRLMELLEDGEIDEYEFEKMLEEWEEGYDAAQESLWEIRTDR